MKWSRGKERSNSEILTIETLQHPVLPESTWAKVGSNNSNRKLRRTSTQLRCPLTLKRIPRTMTNKKKPRLALCKQVQLLMTKKMFSLECVPRSTNPFKFRRSQGNLSRVSSISKEPFRRSMIILTSKITSLLIQRSKLPRTTLIATRMISRRGLQMKRTFETIIIIFVAIFNNIYF